ncbi:MAG: ATPase, partial [Rikenellaceae bacterium]|nr:ATPase [Rikenellaceae bacterium]
PLPAPPGDGLTHNPNTCHPTRAPARRIVRQNLQGTFPRANSVIKPEDIVEARGVVSEVYMDEKIEKYIIDIVFATREPGESKLDNLSSLISYGASPRASISLAKAAKAYAFIKRRGYVIPEDVRAVAYDVLNHRIGLTYEAEAENVTSEDIVTEVLNAVEVP